MIDFERLDNRVLTTVIFDLDTGLRSSVTQVSLISQLGHNIGGHGDFIANEFSQLESKYNRSDSLFMIDVSNSIGYIDSNLVVKSIPIILSYVKSHPRTPIVVMTPFAYDFRLGLYFDRLSRQGVLISASAGNESSPVSNLPTNRMLVSAMIDDFTLWPYSNYGSTVGTITTHDEGTSGAALRGAIAYSIVSDNTIRRPNLRYVHNMTNRIESPPLPQLRYGQFSLDDLANRFSFHRR